MELLIIAYLSELLSFWPIDPRKVS